MSDVFFRNFSENLREFMLLNNITQTELAKIIGTTQQSVSRWLNGKNVPDLETLALICYALNTNPNDILGFEEVDKKEFHEVESYVNVEQDLLRRGNMAGGWFPKKQFLLTQIKAVIENNGFEIDYKYINSLLEYAKQKDKDSKK